MLYYLQTSQKSAVKTDQRTVSREEAKVGCKVIIRKKKQHLAIYSFKDLQAYYMCHLQLGKTALYVHIFILHLGQSDILRFLILQFY